MGARRHTELVVWQLSDDLRHRVNVLTAAPVFGRHEWLQRQLRRAAQSACANIAEGYCRYHPRDFARFLRTAKGSIEECREHVTEALALALIDADAAAQAIALANRASGAATRLIQYLQNSPPR